MLNDPIVEEVHRIREKMLAECDGDLDKLLDRLKEAEEQDRDRLVSKDQMPPRKPAGSA